MKELPPVPMDDYSKAFNQLAVPNASNIRGVYGEAATFRRLKVDEIAQGSGLKADPDSLKVGEMVDYNGPGKQGVDIEGVLDEHELASVSVEIVSTSGRPLFVEVKNYTSRYSTTSLIAQTTNHFKANIIRMVSDTSTTAWKNGKPHLHYEWMGEGFVNPISGMLRTDLINARKAAVLDVCKDMISKRPLKGRVPAFDCETDITFNIVDALLYPLTTKVDESL